MDVKTINRFRKGYLRLTVQGSSSQRFFNLLGANGMDVWEVRKEEEPDQFSFFLTLSEFRKIRPLVRKARVRVRITGRRGLPFLAVRGRKRKGLLLGGASFFLMLYVLSLFIWNISFEGNYHYSRDTLLRFLESQEIVYGMRKKGIVCATLEDNIRSAFPEITWVSARVSGTRLLIKVKENEALSEVPRRDESPCQLTASRGGVITRMIVRQGRAVVAPGDTVEPGQLLVASELAIMDDSGQAVRTAYVHADADIYAKTTYSYREKIPLYHRVDRKTGRRRYGMGVSFGKRRVRYLLPAFGELPWNYTSEYRQLCLFGDFYLPVFWERIVGEEYDSYECAYTKDQQNLLAEQYQQRYLKNFLEKGVQIIENSVKIQENGNYCIIEGVVVCEELIGKEQAVAIPDQEALPKEDADEGEQPNG